LKKKQPDFETKPAFHCLQIWIKATTIQPNNICKD
jgi:hypothetical protein